MVTILGVKLLNRKLLSLKFQEILTEYGCSIGSRIGLHNTSHNKCYPYGLVLLEIVDDEVVEELELKLCQLNEIEIQKMVFKF